MARYYDEQGHELNGLREARKSNGFPSVTTVINSCSPNEYKFLEDRQLRNILSNEYSYEEAMEELGSSPVFEAGHTVHEAAELFYDTKIETEILNCPRSSIEFYDYLKKAPSLYVEEFFDSTHLEVGGRVDLITSDLRLVDYKSVATIKKKPSKSWLLQMGAYYQATMEHNIQIKRAEVVQFSKKDLGVHILSIDLVELNEAAIQFERARGLFRYWYNI